MISAKSNLHNVHRYSEKEPSRLFQQRLDRNERNQPFSEGFMENIRNKTTGELFMVYPEMDPVYETVAGWLKIDSNKLMLHSGSSETIKAVFETYIGPGDRVLLHLPGYAMYDFYCKLFQAEIVSQYFDQELHFDWEAFQEKLDSRTRMVVVENPNGFIGVAPTLAVLEGLIKKAKEAGSIILVDEAYYHFHDETVAPLIDEYDNLIITRTFSKAFGIAGLRAGYLISQPENIAYLRKVRPVYELTSMTALVVTELINHPEEVVGYIRDTKRNLASFRQGLAALGIASSDSKANFLAARLGESSIQDELRSVLRQQDILIRRPFREEALKEWVRIATAPPPVQEAILHELRKILGK
jgi:histidinol-phosphate aminotransferase